MDSNPKKNIRIPDLLKKSREKTIREKDKKKEKSESIDIEYGTDSKKCSKNNSYYTQLEQFKNVMQSCDSCLQKISQFKTKKPDRLNQSKNIAKEQRSTQTTNKPFLINLIEERITELCHQNRRLTRLLIEKDAEVNERQGQISQIQDKFTNILYTLGQELAQLKLSKLEVEQIQQSVETTTQTPAYLKALILDRNT